MNTRRPNAAFPATPFHADAPLRALTSRHQSPPYICHLSIWLEELVDENVCVRHSYNHRYVRSLQISKETAYFAIAPQTST
jgi:hypothetical protein